MFIIYNIFAVMVMDIRCVIYTEVANMDSNSLFSPGFLPGVVGCGDVHDGGDGGDVIMAPC